MTLDRDALTRPIIGIENRTGQEVFDIMCDRFKAALSAREATEGGEAEPFVSGRGWENLSCDDQYALAQQIAANVGYVLTPEPEPEPFPVDAADPSFADALNDSEVRIWINACNHEPARQALRQLLAYRVRGVSTPLRSASIPPSGVAVKPLEFRPAQHPKRLQAVSIIGAYMVIRRASKFALERRTGQVVDLVGLYDRPDQAVAAAQGDYEARISSALTTVPSGVAEAWLIRSDEHPVFGLVRTKEEADRFVKNVLTYAKGPHTNLIALPLVIGNVMEIGS